MTDKLVYLLYFEFSYIAKSERKTNLALKISGDVLNWKNVYVLTN